MSVFQFEFEDVDALSFSCFSSQRPVVNYLIKAGEAWNVRSCWICKLTILFKEDVNYVWICVMFLNSMNSHLPLSLRQSHERLLRMLPLTKSRYQNPCHVHGIHLFDLFFRVSSSFVKCPHQSWKLWQTRWSFHINWLEHTLDYIAFPDWTCTLTIYNLYAQLVSITCIYFYVLIYLHLLVVSWWSLSHLKCARCWPVLPECCGWSWFGREKLSFLCVFFS